MPGVDSILERIFINGQAAIATLTNTGGTADVAGGDASKHTQVRLRNVRPLIVRNDKHGTKSQLTGVKGRRHGEWSLQMDLSPNGTPGTEPDVDPLLESLFGAAKTTVSGTATIASTADSGTGEIRVTTTAGHGFANGDAVMITGANEETNGLWVIKNASGSVFDLRGSVYSVDAGGGSVSRAAVRYDFADANKFFELWRFLSGSLENQVGVGCIANEAILELGQEGPATVQFSGECRSILTSKLFASETTSAKAGLSAFPSEPGSPVTNGGIVEGFIGRVILDDKVFTDAENATITIRKNAEVVKDTLNEGLPNDAQAGRREISVRVRVKDTNDASMDNLLPKALLASALDVIIRIGEVAGNQVMVLLRNVQVEPAEDDDSDLKFKKEFNGIAHGSSTSATDELTLWYA